MIQTTLILPHKKSAMTALAMALLSTGTRVRFRFPKPRRALKFLIANDNFIVFQSILARYIERTAFDD
jgi:hypothetical protein